MKRFGLSRLAAGAVAAAVLVASWSASARAASAFDDDFADGVRGTQWTGVTDDPAALTLAEQGGRLDLLSAGGGLPSNDAIYLSTFRISTATDFVLRLDYTLANPAPGGANGDRLGLVFGVGRDEDGTDSAAIGVGYGREFGFVATAATGAYRIDDAQTNLATETFPPAAGVLELSYAFASDTLTMKRLGSAATFTYVVPAGTVRGTGPSQWGATDGLLVSFGGRGSGMTATAGQLFVDHFEVVSGTVVPEPACLTVVLGLILAGGRGVRRSR